MNTVNTNFVRTQCGPYNVFTNDIPSVNTNSRKRTNFDQSLSVRINEVILILYICMFSLLWITEVV